MSEADVAIIGAGAAGLAAARALARSGFSVEVFEARERVGGRVFPVSGADLGAEFIHGPARETRALLAEIGSAAIERTGESWFWSDGGLQLDEAEFGGHGSLFEGVHRLERDESVADYLQRLRDRGVREDELRGVREFVEGFDAADTTRASVFGIANELLSGVDDQSARPPGGYGPLFEHLQAACVAAGVKIQLASPVSRISWKRSGVRVGGSRARAVIVTLPIGVLRTGDVRFDPPLPSEKTRAIEALVMGPVVKVVLRFRSPFWRELHDGRYRNAGFFRVPGEPFRVFWTQYPMEDNTLNAWIGGPGAEALRACSYDNVVRSARAQCGVLFGDSGVVEREFVEAVLHDWDGDPFSRGAYSYLLVGGGDARAALAQPVEDTLFFAGEATIGDGQNGTVNGAIVSGQRAAREVAAALGAKHS